MSQLNFSQLGFENLKKEKETLQLKRPHAVDELRKARELGDLSENGYYKAARMNLSDIDRRLRELTYVIKNARIYDEERSDIVRIGSTVTLQIEKKEITYKVVGAYEADPRIGKVSDVSPMGRALIGKKAGESVGIEAPSGTIEYTIKKVS